MKVNITQLIRELQGLEKPFMMLMIGPPGVGKSTVLKSLEAAHIKFHVASTDALLEEYAAKHNLTYAQAHQKANFKGIKQNMIGGMKAAFVRRENVINDQTNLASKKRRTTLAEAPADYVRIGVILHAENDVLKKRLAGRQAETGKFVSWGVVEEMFRTSAPPVKGEGFNYLWEFTGDPR
jgi:broad-specificity NMP kinase